MQCSPLPLFIERARAAKILVCKCTFGAHHTSLCCLELPQWVWGVALPALESCVRGWGKTYGTAGGTVAQVVRESESFTSEDPGFDHLVWDRVRNFLCVLIFCPSRVISSCADDPPPPPSPHCLRYLFHHARRLIKNRMEAAFCRSCRSRTDVRQVYVMTL